MAKSAPGGPTKMKLRKGDKVEVLRGKEKGKTGQISRVDPTSNRVIVEGVNVAKRHQRQTSTRLKGGIIDKDMPMPASAVAIVCPKDGATRIGFRFDEDGTKRRVCVHCGGAL
jgi:large subunit ribosomal protein L24